MSLRAFTLRAGAAAGASGRRSTNCVLSMTQQARASSTLGAQPLSASARQIKELETDEKNDVVFESRYGLRTVLLNRPAKLNSLNASMIRKIVPRLIEWEQSDMANVVVLKGTGDKALCAGGDVTALAELNQASADGWKKSAEYFSLEYRLDHYIATYQKPLVSFMDGITMGGGVGLSVHAPFRIATERTLFAMPETTIGFFPDVGASFFLPRMNGSLGTYLALTSDRLRGPNVFYSGIATHYLHSTSLPDLEARLAELRFRDGDSLPRRLELINETLEEFCTGLPYDQPMQPSGAIRQAIDRCFSKNSVAEILAALGQERGETEQWAQKQIQTLHARSPTSVHVALRQMRVGKDWSISETFEKEHQMARKFMQHPDFTEGVTALLVHKRQPEWQPASLEAIPAGEDVARPFFEFDGAEEEVEEQKLELFSRRTYREYPFAGLGVPTEKEIQAVAGEASYTPQHLVQHVVSSRKGRQGVRQVVEEIVGRKTGVNAEGKVVWLEEEEAAASSRL